MAEHRYHTAGTRVRFPCEALREPKDLGYLERDSQAHSFALTILARRSSGCRAISMITLALGVNLL